MQNMPVFLKSLITLCQTVTDTAMHWLGGALAVGVGLPVQHIITRFARRVNSLAEVQSTVGHDVEPDGGEAETAAVDAKRFVLTKPAGADCVLRGSVKFKGKVPQL